MSSGRKGSMRTWFCWRITIPVINRKHRTRDRPLKVSGIEWYVYLTHVIPFFQNKGNVDMNIWKQLFLSPIYSSFESNINPFTWFHFSISLCHTLSLYSWHAVQFCDHHVGNSIPGLMPSHRMSLTEERRGNNCWVLSSPWTVTSNFLGSIIWKGMHDRLW